jgi:catechol 2,3-dioxygenase-like lactoylglutathione lyase family enzyme
MIKINETNVTIMVKNLDQSIKFYESIGLKLKERWEDHYAMVETSGITVGLHPSTERHLGSGSLSIGFMVDSIKEAMEMLEKKELAYKFDDGKSGKYVHFEDPDGTNLYFVEPKWK